MRSDVEKNMEIRKNKQVICVDLYDSRVDLKCMMKKNIFFGSCVDLYELVVDTY